MNEAKFAGGLLGYLEKGGQFAVKRAEISPGHWEVTGDGREYARQSASVQNHLRQQKELHRNFERVPNDLTMSDAAALLLKQSLIAANR